MLRPERLTIFMSIEIDTSRSWNCREHFRSFIDHLEAGLIQVEEGVDLFAVSHLVEMVPVVVLWQASVRMIELYVVPCRIFVSNHVVMLGGNYSGVCRRCKLLPVINMVNTSDRVLVHCRRFYLLAVWKV